ncbi:MAG: hypothetical protein KAH32_04860 [Chlamydiia bacterium]|nr:hypothetical protein [Chlamydiia bacterium]
MKCIIPITIKDIKVFTGGKVYVGRLLDPDNVVSMNRLSEGYDIELMNDKGFWHALSYQLSGLYFEKVNTK